MTRMSLRVEELRVESFAVQPGDARRGPAVLGDDQAAARTLPLEDCFRSVFPTCGIYC